MSIGFTMKKVAEYSTLPLAFFGARLMSLGIVWIQLAKHATRKRFVLSGAAERCPTERGRCFGINDDPRHARFAEIRECKCACERHAYSEKHGCASHERAATVGLHVPVSSLSLLSIHPIGSSSKMSVPLLPCTPAWRFF